jgi:hypothetical protein
MVKPKETAMKVETTQHRAGPQYKLWRASMVSVLLTALALKTSPDK